MMTLIFAVAFAVTNSATVLPTVVVEASRLEAPKIEMPSHVEVIDRAAIDSSGAANTVELLEKRANLFVRKVNSNPAQAQVSMRGYGANGFGRVKILVDGEELNNPDMAPQELIRVPVASVRKVEILHGPQTVLHGSDASAGVINILSDNCTDGKRSEVEVRGGSWGNVGVHAGTRGTVGRGRPTSNEREERNSSNDTIDYYADFDFERSDGWRRNSMHEIWSFKGGVKQYLDNGSWWALKTFYSKTRYGLPGGIYKEGSTGWKERAREADDDESQARNDVYGINLSGKLVINDEQYLTSEFSYRNRRSESYDYLKYSVNTFSEKLKYTWDNEANRLDVGTDLKFDLMDVNGYDPKTDFGGNNDYSRFSGAVFVRDEIKLGEKWSLFGGARGEWWKSRDAYSTGGTRASHIQGELGGKRDASSIQGELGGGTPSSRTRGDVAGEAGVVWRPAEEMKVFAKWARFYHAPLADEMISSYGLPNMNLKPESGHDFELGGDWSFLDEFNFNFTGFHSEIDDEIMYMKYRNMNAEDHTARSGFETSLTWHRERVGSAGLLYSYTFARFTEGEYKGNDVPMVPRQLCRLFGEYYLLDWLSVNGGMRFVGKQRYGGDFAAEGEAIPSFVIFDIGIKIRPTDGWWEGFTIGATVDNLLDKRYFDYGEYFGSHYLYPAAGRSFLVTVRYEF